MGQEQMKADRMNRRILSLLLLSLSAHAELRVPSIFNSGMVLQSGKAVPVWGEADAGAEVTVEFAGQKKTAVTSASGKWRVNLDPMPVSSDPRTLTVHSLIGNQQSEIGNVLVGEVWILAGQSNMGWPLSKCDGGPEAAAQADYPWLKIFKQWPNQGACDKPARDVIGGQWVVCTPEQAAQLSGVGFFFARALQKTLSPGTPVALINTQMGGTYAECWIDFQTLENTPSAKPYLDKAAREIKPGEGDSKSYWGENNFRRPAALFNGKVAPIQPLAARGVIWYQGEGNAQQWLASGYAGTLTALINSWRDGFESPDLPFLVVQLPRYDAGPGSDWPAIRAAQAQVAEVMDGVELIVTIDCGRDDQIHPPDKEPVGERLAHRALQTVYRKE
jgi:sialate O-acetylesterase